MPRGKILVVDDSATECAALSGPLRKEGYTVHCAKDGVTALAELERELPDLILLDVVMPGLNGFQLCRQLRHDARYAQLPIVFVTSKKTDADRHWGFKQGATDYLTKPVDSTALLSTVHQYM